MTHRQHVGRKIRDGGFILVLLFWHYACLDGLSRHPSGRESDCNENTPLVNGDGCCPPGANYQSDTDCPQDCGDSQCADHEDCYICPADCGECCGNGKLDVGEECDTAIVSGEGSCPNQADCGNQQPCAAEWALVGQDCQTRCEIVRLVECGAGDGDGCCPAGCGPNSDTDCPNDCPVGHYPCPHGCCPWLIEEVRAIQGSHTSIALDSQGRAHITYTGDDKLLEYASYKGEDWRFDTVDSSAVVFKSSLALDSSGHPHIFYSQGIYGVLKYTFHDGMAWIFQDVDLQTHSDSGYSSMALDGEDRPHLSFHDSNRNILKFASRNGEQFEVFEVDTQFPVGQRNAIAVDGDGRPHICYYYHDNRELRYSFWDGQNWVMRLVDSHGMPPYSVETFTALSLDDEAIPHISYYDCVNGNLKYAYWTGGTWAKQAVDNDVNVGKFNSLKLDSHSRPHISYYDTVQKNLKYAYWTGLAWERLVVDELGDVGLYTSLALDGQGRPHISYFDETRNILKYARW